MAAVASLHPGRLIWPITNPRSTIYSNCNGFRLLRRKLDREHFFLFRHDVRLLWVVKKWYYKKFEESVVLDIFAIRVINLHLR